MKVVIAIIMNGKNINKLRIFNTNRFVTTDVKISDVKNELRGSNDYFNIKLNEFDEIEFINSDKDKYTKIDELGYEINNKTYVILGIDNRETLLKKYCICYSDGITDVVTKRTLIELKSKEKIIPVNAIIKGCMLEHCSYPIKLNLKDNVFIDSLKKFNTMSLMYLL